MSEPLPPTLDQLPKGGLFRTSDGAEAEGSYAVFPLCEQAPAGGMRFLGTAFFLTTNGLFATARHVVMRRENEPHEPMVAMHMLPNNVFVMRPVLMIAPSRRYDVAVGALAPMIDPQRVELRSKILTLTTRHPIPGEIAATYAYPDTIAEGNEIHVYPAYALGHIEATFPNGRDRTFLPGPCFQTSLVLLKASWVRSAV